MNKATDRATPVHPGLTLLAIPAPSRILLRPDLWFDPGACTILRSGTNIRLTAREAAVLKLLLQAPGRWHRADELAHRLKRRWRHINAHCVEQTICNVRQKLGESGTHPGIILSGYGLGYRLVPEPSSDSPA